MLPVTCGRTTTSYSVAKGNTNCAIVAQLSHFHRQISPICAPGESGLSPPRLRLRLLRVHTSVAAAPGCRPGCLSPEPGRTRAVGKRRKKKRHLINAQQAEADAECAEASWKVAGPSFRRKKQNPGDEGAHNHHQSHGAHTCQFFFSGSGFSIR